MYIYIERERFFQTFLFLTEGSAPPPRNLLPHKPSLLYGAFVRKTNENAPTCARPGPGPKTSLSNKKSNQFVL